MTGRNSNKKLKKKNLAVYDLDNEMVKSMHLGCLVSFEIHDTKILRILIILRTKKLIISQGIFSLVISS